MRHELSVVAAALPRLIDVRTWSADMVVSEVTLSVPL
jgi:hypothetical protein